MQYMYILRLACATQERFLATYPAKQTASVDLEGTVYAVAAFYLCAKKLKVMVVPMLGIMVLFPKASFAISRQNDRFTNLSEYGAHSNSLPIAEDRQTIDWSDFPAYISPVPL